MQKVNREMIGLAADATELQVRVYYNGFYGEDGPLPVTDDGSRNYWLWNSSESKSSGAVTFTLSEEKLTPTPTPAGGERYAHPSGRIHPHAGEPHRSHRPHQTHRAG